MCQADLPCYLEIDFKIACTALGRNWNANIGSFARRATGAQGAQRGIRTVSTSTDVISSVNPRTGLSEGEVASATSATQVAEIARRAAAASPMLDSSGRGFRANLLRAIADDLEGRRDAVVAVADRETAIGEARLNGELTRTVYQARLFADVLDEGSYLEAAIDHAAVTPMGPGPDLRRMLVPLGPVAVFGSSNFPLAFSVPGGDTVSAIAAGCSVVLKAHGSHPATSLLCFEILDAAARKAGAPEGTFGMVFGQDAGSTLVADPAIRAVGFTGSLSGGEALLRVISSRDDPIPFYGELSSINPVVISPAAARVRGEQIAADLLASVALAAGQLCTKPGVALVPRGPEGDALVAALSAAVGGEPPRVLLNSRIRTSYLETTGRLRSSGISVLGEATTPGGPLAVLPVLFEVEAPDVTPESVEECFGPTMVVIRYGDVAELLEALSRIPSSLTGTLHSEPSERGDMRPVVEHFRRTSGRIVFDGYPTGVLVGWAQTHGGPWPATNSLFTSVGTSAIRRFLRPVTWQNAPAEVLPEELRDDFTSIPRRVDGQVVA